MRMVHKYVIEKELQFAQKAAKAFEEDDKIVTYTENGIAGIKDEALFAVKWGVGNDCVLVFRIQGEPTIYQQIINTGDF